MKPWTLTVISLKMWSRHLLQTVLRSGGNPKMVRGWYGDKFQGVWLVTWKGFTDYWVFVITIGFSILELWPLTDLLPEALTSLGKIRSFFLKYALPIRKKSFMRDQRSISWSSYWGGLGERGHGPGAVWGGRGKALHHLRPLFLHKTAFLIFINPKGKGRINAHHLLSI